MLVNGLVCYYNLGLLMKNAPGVWAKDEMIKERSKVLTTMRLVGPIPQVSAQHGHARTTYYW